MKNFESYHPLVLFTFFISSMLVTMLTKNPLILGISFLGSFSFCSILQRPKMILINLIFYIPLFLLISITNPLFSHNGQTILFFLNDQRVTLEAIYYGMAIAGMIITILYWSKCYNEIMTSDKFLYLFGKITPKISLVISMSIRFIPLFKNQIKKVSSAQKTMGLYTSKSLVDRIGSGLRVFSAIITWAFENAINTSDSMKARGYGLRGRTNYSLFRFTLRDGLMLTVILFLDIIIIITSALGYLEFYYYPTTSNLIFGLGLIITLITIFLLMFIPVSSEVKENIKWRYLKSKI